MIASPPHAPKVTVLGVEGFEQPLHAAPAVSLRRHHRHRRAPGVPARPPAPRRRPRGLRLRRRDARREVVRQEPGAQRRAEPGPAAPRDRARGRRLPGRAAVDAVRPLRRQLPLPDPRRPRARPAAAGRELRQRAGRPRRARRGLPPARRRASGRRCAANLAGMVPHPVIADLGDFDFTVVPRRPGAGAEHRGAPHGRPRRPDHGRRPGHRRARRRRPAGDARGGRAPLRPALLQAQGRAATCAPTSTG